MVVIAAVALAQWVRRRERPPMDAALLFGALAVGLGLRETAFLPQAAPAARWMLLVGSILAIGFPVLLLRVVRQFHPVPRLIWGLALGGFSASLAIVLGRHLGYTPLMERTAEAQLTILAYVGLVVLYAAGAFFVGAVEAQGVARRRMRLAAVATGLLAMAAAAWAPAAARGQAGSALAWGLVLIAVLVYFLVFTPPAGLLANWRSRELQRYLRGLDATNLPRRASQGVDLLCRTADRLLDGRYRQGSSVVVLGDGVEVVAPQAPQALVQAVTAARTDVARQLGRFRQPAFLERRRGSPPHERWLLDLFDADFLAVVPMSCAGIRHGTLVTRLDHVLIFLWDTLRDMQLLAEQASLAISLHKAASERERMVIERYRAESKALQREKRALEEASRLKSGFLANMSHELRTPLNSIIGFAELLRGGKVGEQDERTKEFLGDILTSARHLHQLINDVLDLAKVESGRLDFDPQPLDVEDLCQEVLGILHAMVAEKRHHVTVEVDDGARHAVLDATRLKQVLYNYLSNAIKFTDEDGTIHVAARAVAADQIRVEVHDNGIGIAPADQDRLFQEFEQLEAGRAKRHQGTGLGLALVKRLAEAQGGHVGVESRPGEGSTFWAELPTRHPPDKQRDAASIQAGARVLVVEDDRHDRHRILQALEGEGYNTDAVGTAREAKRRVRHIPYDAVVLDIILPDGDGNEVLQAMRSEGPNQNLPVIVVSIVPQKELGLAFPVQGYLEKPVRPAALTEALRAAGIRPEPTRPVLVVDDDEPTSRLMEAELLQAGLKVRVAQNGVQAMEQVRRDPPSMVVLDLVMQDMDGFAFLHWLRSAPGFQSVPVIVWSHKHLTREDRARLSEAAQVVLSKNSGPHTLLAALREALREPRTLMEVHHGR